MKLSDFNYNLPKDLIAQEPASPRDHSRLLVLKCRKLSDRGLTLNCEIEHKHFFDIADYLRAGDVLVLNNSKVIKARLMGKKKTGGKMEVFLVNKISMGVKESWKCMVGGRGAKVGLEIEFKKGLKGKINGDNGDGTFVVEFDSVGGKFMKIIDEIGQVPLPPYIKQESDDKNIKNYQTVFADQKKEGSVAAPTAGLHFTKELLAKLKKKGVQVEYITLHVGLGTFAPVKVDNVMEHKMHAEYVEIEADVIKRILVAKSEGRRVVAVGTTSVRSLEAAFANTKILTELRRGRVPCEETLPERYSSFSGWVDIFIYPGYEFKIVDAIITNFHLPKSTLLMLVSAFAGKDHIDEAYREAIKKKYRFFSYGDAMFLFKIRGSLE